MTSFFGVQIEALWIVFLAGFSTAISQSIILFINGVKPHRFLVSLIFNGLVFVFSFIFLSYSTWLIGSYFFDLNINYRDLINLIALSYWPLRLSFLGAMPHFGLPFLFILWIYTLYLMVVNLAVNTNLNFETAFLSLFLSWVLVQILRHTAGKPVGRIGNFLRVFLAGTNLQNNLKSLKKILDQRSFEPLTEQKSLDLSNKTSIFKKIVTIFTVSVFILLGLIFIFSGNWFEPIFSLILIAILLTPLEALGWWAGWYDYDTFSTKKTATLVNPESKKSKTTGFVIYLDGVGQTDFDFDDPNRTNSVEFFLKELAQKIGPSYPVLRGFMPYSVLNRPLTFGRPLSFLWKYLDHQKKQYEAAISNIVNLRNIFAVIVSTESRYGDFYNFAVAQNIYYGLLQNGYSLKNPLPVIFIGYSGGVQIAMGASKVLSKSLNTKIKIISMGGVFGGNNDLSGVKKFYHLAGDKDWVEKSAHIMYPRRWRINIFSRWNKDKKTGKIEFIKLGKNVKHRSIGGIIDKTTFLKNGQSHLNQTIQICEKIVKG